MAVIYPFPSGLYKPEYTPSSLDEIEIIEPLGANLAKSTGAPNVARCRLGVNSMTLHDIVVTITLTRYQSGLPAPLPVAVPPAAAPPNMVASNGAVFTYYNNDATTPAYEAKWTRSQLKIFNDITFEVPFDVGAAVGSYVLTYRIMALELQTAMTHTETLVVS